MVVLNRAQLERSVAARLCGCSHDELRVIDRVLDGIETGRENYGPLDIKADVRKFDREAEQELRDMLFYLAAQYVADQARARDQRQAEYERIVGAGLDELRDTQIVTTPSPRLDLANPRTLIDMFDPGGEE